MNKEGTIIIRGRQDGSDHELITVKAPVTYHFQNNKHFARFEERDSQGLLVTKNILKIASNQVDIMKRGINNSHMVFRLDSLTKTNYHTPYGMMEFQIKTTDLDIKEAKDLIEVNLKYDLLSDNNIISSNDINITITSAETSLR
jgi:uncharacterized beta-barrel protein YwiB (DUF1934 family)